MNWRHCAAVTLTVVCAGLLLGVIVIRAVVRDGNNLTRVELDIPAGEPKGVVLLLTPDTERERTRAYVSALIEQNYAAISIPLASIMAASAAVPDCSALAALLQAFARESAGGKPIVVGIGAGGALAAQIAQRDAGDFHAVVSVDYCPLEPAAAGCRPGAPAPAQSLAVPWFIFQHRATDAACQGPGVAASAAATTGAKLTWLAASPDGAPAVPAELSALLQWLDPRIGQQAQSAQTLVGIPLIEQPVPGARSAVVFLSGDGGWAEFDRTVSAVLVRSGLAVIGWDSLSYFWQARSPDELGRDLERVLEHYRSQWGIERFVLVGYSFGANVLPFAVNRLPPASGAQVAHVVLLAPARATSFEFHLTQWLGQDGSATVAVAPEIARLAPLPLLCVHGATDGEASCPPVAAPSRDVVVPGDHHFNDDYARIAGLIEAAAHASP